MGYNPDPADTGGRTLLAMAARYGHKMVVELLLAKDGVNPNSKDKDGRAPLAMAAIYRHEVVVKLLLAKDGVDLNSKDKYGRTPLSYAAEKGYEAVVKLVVRDGVDPYSKDKDRRTPLSWDLLPRFLMLMNRTPSSSAGPTILVSLNFGSFNNTSRKTAKFVWDLSFPLQYGQFEDGMVCY